MNRDLLLKDLIVKIGSKIKSEREKKGWDVIELTIRSKVNQQTIYNLENGLCNPTLKTLINITDALGITLQSLFQDIPPA